MSPPLRSHSTRAPLFHLGHPDEHIPFFEPPDYPSPPVARGRIILFALFGIILAFLGQQFEHLGAGAITPDVAISWMLPFALLLTCIASMPFIAKHFWEKYYAHVAIALAIIVSLYYLFALNVPAAANANFFERHAGRSLARSFGEYITFIFLLGSLYTVSGGILIRVRRKATPGVNAMLLLAGAILANVLGTTGAAMLLIRPYLRINKGHIRPFHIVFFIFLVANVGGCLTPIGDPPLFLGYLKGVPFWWVLEKCWPMWLVAVALLLTVFFILDTRAHAGEKRADHDPDDLGPAISIFGVSNLLLVLVILAGVLMHDQFNVWWSALKIPHLESLPLRELIMTAAIAISLRTTPRRIHVENIFNFAPIREVALLFIGIFATMVPALNYLSVHADDPALASGLHTPGQFYFASGTLSAALDNAPTYLTFLETEIGKLDKNQIAFVTQIIKTPNKNRPVDEDYGAFVAAHPDNFKSPQDASRFQSDASKAEIDTACAALVKYHGDSVAAGTLKPEQIQIGFLLGNSQLEWYIIAISLGAVFFGAMTYIGNGPNFMVKSIAENGSDASGVKCPSFFGYILGYSLPILLPILILTWAIFLASHGHP